MPAVHVKTPTVLRNFETDAKEILEGMGMHLTRDGRWKHFAPERLQDLTWGDIRAFVERNYDPVCRDPECPVKGHPDRFEEWKQILTEARKQARADRGSGTLYKGSGAIVGQALIPIKLKNALMNDFPEDFGGLDGDYASPSDFLRALERCSNLDCFVIVPSRSHGL